MRVAGLGAVECACSCASASAQENRTSRGEHIFFIGGVLQIFGDFCRSDRERNDLIQNTAPENEASLVKIASPRNKTGGAVKLSAQFLGDERWQRKRLLALSE